MAAVLVRIFWLMPAVLTVHYAGALEIYAPGELFVENGANARLPCTFSSTEETNDMTTIVWTYTEEGFTSEGIVIFIFFDEEEFPARVPQFKDRVTWTGDINNKDVSIKIDKITFKDNGTYGCSVLNHPDIFSPPKQIKLRVVEKGNSSVAREKKINNKVHYAGALEIYAPGELFVENGANARLPCTFNSTEETSLRTSFVWTYTEEGSTSGGVVVFLFMDGKEFPARVPQFKDRVTWTGDINNKDVSIKIDKITFKDNGTYGCSVMNPPDILSTPKQIKLRVVEKESSDAPWLDKIIKLVMALREIWEK